MPHRIIATLLVAVFLFTSCDPPPQYSVGIMGRIATEAGLPVEGVQGILEVTMYDALNEIQIIQKEILTNQYGVFFASIESSELTILPFSYEAILLLGDNIIPLEVEDEELPSERSPEGMVRFSPIYLPSDIGSDEAK